jgi:hypothetical protein
MNTQFSCVGCGKCCSDHHVPLTLEEARMWAADGGNVIVLVEGFLGNGLGLPQLQREHAERRSVVVPSGNTEAFVAITFAAYNAGAAGILTKTTCAASMRAARWCVASIRWKSTRISR